MFLSYKNVEYQCFIETEEDSTELASSEHLCPAYVSLSFL